MTLLFKTVTSLSIADASSTIGSVGHVAQETEYLEPQLGFATTLNTGGFLRHQGTGREVTLCCLQNPKKLQHDVSLLKINYMIVLLFR